ncbi:cytochrome D1 domain-containing protein [Paenibacillus herberti]|uniref:PQQ-dependent protein n=1 Tax=Paenibacillus herberti TaxID=1619309 RepID=A0A229NT81_9BACL|nr:cytochrome D1 domain-containing protein [Paenibacillus herberti]OXM13068.1 hypothetical protein CGZ75_23085 [Paenibacillus herberti]
MDRKRSLAYVSNQNGSSVSVIDTVTNKVVKTIPVNKNPNAINFSPDKSRLYTSNVGSRSVSVISRKTNTVIQTIQNVLPEPFGIAAVSNKVYVPGQYSGEVAVINARSFHVIERFQVANGPVTITAAPSGQQLYVTTLAQDIFIINIPQNKVVQTLPSGPIWGLVFTPSGKSFIVTNFDTNQITIYSASTNKPIAQIPVGLAPLGLAISSSGLRAYVANSRSRSVSVIDLVSKRVIKTIPVGTIPYGVTVTPNKQTVYVTNYDSNTVSVIDAQSLSVIKTIPVGAGPRGIVSS